jgi:hypothetical protein
MMYALVDNGDVIKFQEMENLDAIPDHKKHWFLPVVDERPISSPLEKQAGPETIIEPDKVIRRWTGVRIPLETQQQIVKGICRKKILAVFPEWKQTNMTARGVELLSTGPANWTDQDKAEAMALQTAWAWIKSMRQASNVIEAMSPIPADFMNGKYWPETPSV